MDINIFAIAAPGLLVQIPIYLTLFVGIIVALVNLFTGKNRTPAVLALIGFFILLLMHVIGPFLSGLPYILNTQYNIDPIQIGIILTSANLVLNLILAAAFMLIIIAIFSSRKQPNPA